MNNFERITPFVKRRIGIYTRTCKRCGDRFPTTAKHGRFCELCNKNSSLNKRRNGKLPKILRPEKGSPAYEFNKSLKKKNV